MIQRDYEGFKLKLYSSMVEYEQVEEATFSWHDADGKELNLKTEDLDLSNTLGKEHLSSDETLKKAPLWWEAVKDTEMGLGVNCIILDKPQSIDFEEIITTCGHEYGHISDADKFKNSTEAYETLLGYEQEETKALAFKKFVCDSYKMALLYKEMFLEVGIEVIGC